jgi:hypothetical protein
MTLYHDVQLIGCSIYGNDAQEDCGGLYAGYGSRVSIESSVLWGNTDLGSTEILKRNLKKDASALVEELWSCIEGLQDEGTAGCIALDPRFADPDATRPDIPATEVEIDGVAELWFDDAAALHTAAQSPEMRALHADGALFIGRIKSYVVEEKVIVG